MQSLRTYVRTIAIVASIASVVDILIDSSLDVSICIRNHHVRTYVCSSILDASISISTTYCLRRRHHHLSSLRTYAGSPGFAICPRTHIPRTYVRTQLSAPSHTTSPMAGWGQARRHPRPDVQVGSYWVSKAPHSAMVPQLYRTSPQDMQAGPALYAFPEGEIFGPALHVVNTEDHVAVQVNHPRHGGGWVNIWKRKDGVEDTGLFIARRANRQDADPQNQTNGGGRAGSSGQWGGGLWWAGWHSETHGQGHADTPVQWDRVDAQGGGQSSAGSPAAEGKGSWGRWPQNEAQGQTGLQPSTRPPDNGAASAASLVPTAAEAPSDNGPASAGTASDNGAASAVALVPTAAEAPSDNGPASAGAASGNGAASAAPRPDGDESPDGDKGAASAAAAAALEPTAAGTASDDGAASAAAPVPTAAEAPSDNGAASAAAPQTQPPPGRGPLATVPKSACFGQ